MRTKRYTSFVPQVGDKTSPGIARQSRQRRRKQLHRKRARNKVPTDSDCQSDLTQQTKYDAECNREASASGSSLSNRELTVEHSCALSSMAPFKPVENHARRRQNRIPHSIPTTIASNRMMNEVFHVEQVSEPKDDISNLTTTTTQHDRWMMQPSCPPPDEFLLEPTLLSQSPPENLTAILHSAVELLDDSTTAGLSFHLDSYTGPNWMSGNQEQLIDLEDNNIVPNSKAESSPYSLFGNWTEEDIQGQAVEEEEEEKQSNSMECPLQPSQSSTNPISSERSSDEDIFDVIWQSLFEPHRCHEQRKIATPEQQQQQQPQRFQATSADPRPSSCPVSREKKLNNFCSPFLRRLYSHH